MTLDITYFIKSKKSQTPLSFNLKNNLFMIDNLIFWET
jgi:hypothetical protein